MRVDVLLWGAVVFLGGCELLDEKVQLNEDGRCPSDFDSMVNTSEPPSLIVENAIHPEAEWSEYGGLNGIGGAYILEAWDCIDDSWWTPAEQQLTVQLRLREEDCSLSYAELFFYPCGSMEGVDAPYRDVDGDGIMAIEGDCDDLDPAVGVALLCDEDFEEEASEESEDLDTGG